MHTQKTLTLPQSLLLVFQDSHHFSNLSSKPSRRQSLLTIFQDSHHANSHWRQPSLRQSLMTTNHQFGSLWWQSLMTALLWQHFSHRNASRSLSGKTSAPIYMYLTQWHVSNCLCLTLRLLFPWHFHTFSFKSALPLPRIARSRAGDRLWRVTPWSMAALSLGFVLFFAPAGGR